MRHGWVKLARTKHTGPNCALWCLQVRQGAGYLYVHQGCCEHLLELTDVRSAHDSDPLLINHFPQVLGQVLLYALLFIVFSAKAMHGGLLHACNTKSVTGIL